MIVEILKQKGHNFLWIDDELWMWDIPIEAEIQKEIAKQASGDVLVAGYGLGLVHRYLQKNISVKSIITVEDNEKVINECQKANIPIIGNIVIDDFFSAFFDIKFDYVIGDLWIDIVPEILPLYKKFKERALYYLKKPHEDKILSWGKDYFEYLINK